MNSSIEAIYYLLNLILNYEPGIFDEIKKYTKNYTFENKRDLEVAVESWDQNKVTAFELYGQISHWDVSKITSMSRLFYLTFFNCDISRWDVSKVITMECMFQESQFDSDISDWNVSNVINMFKMFAYSKFNYNISKWNVSKVTNMSCMFEHIFCNPWCYGGS